MKLLLLLVSIISYSSICYSQVSLDKLVLHPKVDLSQTNLPENGIVREYLPFDDITVFYSIYGAQAYKTEETYINIFPIAISPGDVKKYNSNMTVFLQFDSNLEGNTNSSFSNSELVILFIDNKGDVKERFATKLDENMLPFKNYNSMVQFIDADSVRGRLSNGNNFYEIDLSTNIRRMALPLLIELNPNVNE